MELTKEQTKKLEESKQEWLNLIFNAKEPDHEVIKEKVLWLYRYCNLVPPKGVLVLHSPKACQIAANILMADPEYTIDRNDSVGMETLVKNYTGPVKHYEPRGCNIFDAAWVATFDGLKKIGYAVKAESFEEYTEFVKSGIAYSLYFDDVAIVSVMPEYFKRDEQNQPHCTDGPAILWRDGYTNWFRHGKPLEGAELIQAKAQWTVSNALHR